MSPVVEGVIWLIVAGFAGVLLFAVFAWAPGRESRREEKEDGKP